MKKIENTALQMIAEASRCPDYGPDTAGYKKKYPLSLRRQYRTQRWFSGHGQPERMD